jgi:hypothetical protein
MGVDFRFGSFQTKLEAASLPVCWSGPHICVLKQRTRLARLSSGRPAVFSENRAIKDTNPSLAAFT